MDAITTSWVRCGFQLFIDLFAVYTKDISLLTYIIVPFECCDGITCVGTKMSHN